ncbi:MAG: carbohydrate ABC transporter permease, partial [Candidatus Rokubacteria bacterium]|nr:carbohydrate ABC transporter permease [Candidatus Rokubacteria bacterium]
MIEGPRWKKWVYFYLPLTLFIVGVLFPFYWMLITAIRPDHELYRSWRAVNNAPFWTLNPTLAHFQDLLQKTAFPVWLWNTMFIAVLSTLIALFCGLLAGYALARLNFPLAGGLGTAIFVTYLVPPTLLFIPLADIIRNFKLGNTPWALILTYPTFLIPFCTWLLMGYFKTIPKELE